MKKPGYIQTNQGVLELTPSKKYLKLSRCRYALMNDVIKVLNEYKVKKNYKTVHYNRYFYFENKVRVFDIEDKMKLEDKFDSGIKNNSWGNKILFIGCKNFRRNEVINTLRYLRKNKIKI